MRTLVGLSIAVFVLLGTNVFTAIKWGGAKAKAEAECSEQMVKAASLAIEKERERETAADRAAEAIKAEVSTALTEGMRDAGILQTRIVRVPVDGGCRWPDGLPSVQPAIDAANAAFGH